MNLQQLFEAPLPPDWDPQSASLVGKRNFKNVIAYATERAKKIGSGTSRVAFEVEYEGRPTILKIAKNAKGLAQNSEEVKLLNDGYLRHNEAIIPLIDFDEANGEKEIRWVHTEKADKISEKEILEGTGVDNLSLFVWYAADSVRGKLHHYASRYASLEAKIDHDSELLSNLQDIFGTFKEVSPGDLTIKQNWGKYDGRPVIIDLGVTTETEKLYLGK